MAGMQSRRAQVPRRAIVAAIALYALLVQGLLAGFAPLKAPPDPSGEPAALLCSHKASSGSSHDLPADQEHGCCLAACSAAFSAGPGLAPFATAAWLPRRTTMLVWSRSAAPLGARYAFSPVNARGPPLV